MSKIFGQPYYFEKSILFKRRNIIIKVAMNRTINNNNYFRRFFRLIFSYTFNSQSEELRAITMIDTYRY